MQADIISYKDKKDSINLVLNEKKDSLFVWYNYQQKDSVGIEIKSDTTILDTLWFKGTGKKQHNYQFKLSSPKHKIFNENYAINIKDTFNIKTKQPLINVFKENITLQIDSILLPIDSANIFINAEDEIAIQYPWKDSVKYKLTFYPMAMEDFFNQKNKDTIQHFINGPRKEIFGDLLLNFVKFDSLLSYHYIS